MSEPARIAPARPRRTPGIVEFHELSGYELAPHGGHVDLLHRCGASFCLPLNGITRGGATYLANTVATAADNPHSCSGSSPRA